jgi:hypothetical protein
VRHEVAHTCTCLVHIALLPLPHFMNILQNRRDFDYTHMEISGDSQNTPSRASILSSTTRPAKPVHRRAAVPSPTTATIPWQRTQQIPAHPKISTSR